MGHTLFQSCFNPVLFSRISKQGPTSRGLHPDPQEPEPRHLEAPVDVRTEPETRNPETRRPKKAQPALTVQEDEAVASVAGRGGEEEQVQLSIQTVKTVPFPGKQEQVQLSIQTVKTVPFPGKQEQEQVQLSIQSVKTVPFPGKQEQVQL